MDKIINALKAFVAMVPYTWLKALAWPIAMAAYAGDKRHRVIVKRNLKFIFPEYDRRQIDHITRQVFINTGITLFEILQFFCYSRKHFYQKIIFCCDAETLDLVKKDKSIIFISGHIGNWESVPFATSLFFHTSIQVVQRPLDMEMLDRLMTRSRTRYGNMMVAKNGALQKLARTLRGGNSVGMIVDQDVRPAQAIKADFLGKATNTSPAAAFLAGRYGCPVAPIFCFRNQKGQLKIDVKKPLALVKTKNPKADVRVNTQLINNAISEAIMAHVDQWFWFHKRWKRFYPDLYPEEARRLEREKRKKAMKQAKKR